MPTFTPDFLTRATGGIWTVEPLEPMTGFTQDTRKLGAGQVFVALKTDKRDGYDFLSAAQEAGARAAIVGRFNPACTLPQLLVADPLKAFQAIAREHRRTFSGPVIGISGSAGKTSTKNLLAQILGGAPAVLATEGNLNNHLGVPLTLTRLDPEQHTFAVIEAGISEPGEMGALAEMIEPDVAIITLVAPAHVEALGSIDGVAREKAVLPAGVRAAGVAIFSKATLDFPAFRDLKVRTLVVEPAETVTAIPSAPDTVYFTVVSSGEHTEVSLVYGTPPPLVFRMRRVSAGMAQNAALAISAALWLGLPAEAIRQRLAGWAPATLRGELQHDGERWLYLDCYNANPASMADALANFYQIAPPSEPRLFIVGGMEELGAESGAYHRALGRMLHLRPGDYCFIIGSEAEAVRLGALENGNQADQYAIVGTIEPIVAHVEAFRGAVFVKGSRKYALERVVPARGVNLSYPLIPPFPRVEPRCVAAPGVMSAC